MTCGNNVECFQTPDDLIHIAGPVPDEGDYTTELEGKWGVDGTLINPNEVVERRTEGRNKVYEEDGSVRSCR